MTLTESSSAFAVTSAAANAQTVGDLVDSLCAPVKAQLSDPEGDFSTLFAALNAINDVELSKYPIMSTTSTLFHCAAY